MPRAVMAQEPSPAAPPEADDVKKAQAKEHFLRGLELSAEESWDRALVEYTASRALFSTKAASKNAALCLSKLKRYDEALDLFESIPKEFQNLTPEDLQFLDRESAKVRPYVGALALAIPEVGASVVVDGRPRGTSPLAAPLRVSIGTHLVRVAKAGFAPFESRVEVSSGATRRVDVALEILQASGRLSVIELKGQPAEVLLDGIPVGQTPWEAVVGTGEHTVSLRGQQTLGTQPVRAPVTVNQTTVLRLGLEALDAEVRIEPVPVSATVAVDGVSFGRGAWEGRLRSGPHQLEVGQEGFVAQRRTLVLQANKREALTVSLERDRTSPIWETVSPPKVFVELAAGPKLSPTMGGDILGCEGCKQGIGFGGQARVLVGYELGWGLGFGGELGYAALRQTAKDRVDALRPLPVGANADNPGLSDDAIAVYGPVVGASASYRTSGKLRFRFRLGVGAWLGSATDERSGNYNTAVGLRADGSRAGAVQYSATTAQTLPATFLYARPEVRAGYKLSEKIELGLGVEILALFALNRPRWEPTAQRVVTGNCATPGVAAQICATDGLAVYDTRSFTAPSFFVASPTLSFRYEF